SLRLRLEDAEVVDQHVDLPQLADQRLAAFAAAQIGCDPGDGRAGKLMFQLVHRAADSRLRPAIHRHVSAPPASARAVASPMPAVESGHWVEVVTARPKRSVEEYPHVFSGRATVVRSPRQRTGGNAFGSEVLMQVG